MKNFKTFLLLLLAIPFFISCENDEPSTDKGESSESETEIVKECVEYDGLLFDGILYYEVINSTYARVNCVDEDLCVGKIVIPHKIKFDKNVYSVTEIGEFAFDGCEELLNIKIPNSITYIGEEAFETCVGLDKIIIPNSVTYIGEEAFAGCCRLSRIACLATTPPTIYEDTFDEVSCPLYIPKDCISVYKAADYWNNFNDMFEWDEFLPEFGDIFVSDCLCYMVTKGAEEVAVTGHIDDSSYSGEIIIPESVKFNGITYSVTSIGEEAFYGCTGLTSIEIPNSVTSIREEAFYGCTGLTSIEIPNSVTSIGGYAFYCCSSLTSIEIPNSVTSIEGYTFCNCSSLTSIEIPNSVTSIGDCAFNYCTGLTSIEIPNSVTSIGYRAFSGCSGLTSIVIEEGNTVYDSRENCNAIIETATNILIVGCQNSFIPNSVTSINEYAFEGCTGLTSIEIPNSVTSIGESVFEFCTGLTSVTIGNSVTSIGEEAFYCCTGLTSVTIGNSVTSIGEEAFSGCSGLTSLTIGKSVTSIDDGAFHNCNAINIIDCKTTEAPACDGMRDPFESEVYLSANLYVPIGSKNSYKNSEGWSQFRNIIEKDFSEN